MPALVNRLAALAFLVLLPLAAAAQDAEGWRHGGALFGELKYGPDFTHFDYVNPDAPKGGTLHDDALGTFDSFNPFVVRGEPAAGVNFTGGLLWDTLMEQATDQPSAAYGLIAEAFRFPDDFSSATYRIRKEARFHDGAPITAEDVIWSLEVLKQNHPHFNQYYHNVVSAVKTGEREVTFTFDVKGNRELPHILGDLPVLPKHWWEGVDAKGTKRNIAEPTSESPLGSGPYRIASFDSGKTVTYERVKDYWAKDLPTRKGRYNFDRIQYTYFLDENAAWEAFKKGGIADTRAENRSQRWAKEYDFPAFTRGDVVRKAFSTDGPKPFQAYFMNTRNPKFKDSRVRNALNLLFDFESMNKTLFYGLYKRTDSYFEGGELQAGTGKPEGRTLEILESYRGRIPDAAIDGDLAMPVHGNPADTRRLQREALKLFTEAGYSFKGGRMLGPDGKQFEIEILGSGPTDERVGIPTVDYFGKLGIKTNIRIVDQAQYRNRMDKFDFEMTMSTLGQSLSPGNEQRDFWSSRAASLDGSRNLAGISDPAIDEIVEKIITAPDRQELVALTRALDRILLAGSYSIPMWHNPDVWFAWWNRLKLPERQPSYTGIDLYSWWIEEAGSGGGSSN
jgi:microcin C transport system substrate-binding protein